MQHGAYSQQYRIISLKYAMLNILTIHTQQNNKGGGGKLWLVMSMPLKVVMVNRCMLTPKLVQLYTLNMHSF